MWYHGLNLSQSHAVQVSYPCTIAPSHEIKSLFNEETQSVYFTFEFQVHDYITEVRVHG